MSNQLARSFLLLCLATVCAAVPEIFLPPDAEVVTIVGNNFSLQVNQLVKIKDGWKDVVAEAASVEKPRDGSSNPSDGGAGENGVSNDNLFEKTVNEVGAKNFGSLDEDLLDWITTRATNLANKIERYEGEIAALKDEERLVVQIMLLNTLVDLDNLIKENIRANKWIKKKVNIMENSRVFHSQAIKGYVSDKIQENKEIERKIKSTNKPTDKWLKNVALVKRILHEQRHSDELRSSIVDYLGGSFAMMKRSTVFDLNRTNKNLNDGLYYARARGRVPAHFPFSAQDAIVNDA